MAAPAPETQISLPIGFLFRPTDEELVCYYLRRKVLKKEYPNAIAEVELYNYEPEDLRAFSRLHSTSQWYFFTRIRKFANSSLIKRDTNKHGRWVVGGQPLELANQNGKVKGNKRVFTYHRKSPGWRDYKTSWKMEEFTLTKLETRRNLQVDLDSFALCKISSNIAAISGIKTAVGQMKVGEIGRVIIPPSQGYQNTSEEPIPPNYKPINVIPWRTLILTARH